MAGFSGQVGMMPGSIPQLAHTVVVSFRAFVLIFQKRTQLTR
jgi:hypothetical protein